MSSEKESLVAKTQQQEKEPLKSTSAVAEEEGEEEVVVEHEGGTKKKVTIHNTNPIVSQTTAASGSATSSSTTVTSAGGGGGGGGGGGARLKVIFTGAVSVGKSSIIARFMYDAYDRHYRATLGIDFLAKLVTVDGRTVRLQLYDTAGQERFASLIPSYIRNSHGAIVVFDVTSRESFIDTTKWVDDIRQEKGGVEEKNIHLFLVGNKIDLGDEKRAVTTEEGEAKAREFGATYIEVSAKTGQNIKSLFRKVATTIPIPDDDVSSASAAGGFGGGLLSGAGAGGGTGSGGSGLPIRRIDPLLVTPSRTASTAAAAGSGDGDASGGYCSC